MWKMSASRHFNARCSSLGRNVVSRTIELQIDLFPLALVHYEISMIKHLLIVLILRGRKDGVRRNSSPKREGTCIVQNWLKMRNSPALEQASFVLRGRLHFISQVKWQKLFNPSKAEGRAAVKCSFASSSPPIPEARR